MNIQIDFNSHSNLPQDPHRGQPTTPESKSNPHNDAISFVQLKDTPSLSRVSSRDQSNSRPPIVKIQSQLIRVQSRTDSRDKETVVDIPGANSSFTSGMFQYGNQEIDVSTSQRSLAEAGLLLIKNISSSSNYQAGPDMSPKESSPHMIDLTDDKMTDINDDSGSNTPTRPLNNRNLVSIRLSKQPSYRTSNFAAAKSLFSAQGQREETKVEDDIDITPINAPSGGFTQMNDVAEAEQGNIIDLEANAGEDAQPRGTRPLTSNEVRAVENRRIQQAGARIVPISNQNEEPAPVSATSAVAPQATNNSVHPDAEQVSPRLQRFYVLETKIYLTKVSGGLLGLLIGAICLLLMSYDKIPFDYLMVTAFCALFFETLIDVFWSIRKLDQLYLDSDHIYASYDITAGTLSLVLVYFKMTKIFSLCTFACAPLMLMTLCYLFFSKAACEVKTFNLIIKTLYSVQVLLVTMKIDNKLNCDILYILFPCWIMIGIYLSKFVLVVCSLSRRVFLSSNMSMRLRTIGLLWYSLLYGLSVVVLIILYGVMNTFSGSKITYDSTRFACHLTIGFTAGLLVLTILARKHLIKFIAVFGLIKSLRAEEEASKVPTQVRTISFQVEKKQNYFVMLSSTYFQPLQKNIMSKGKEGFEKFKTMLYNLKMGKSNPEKGIKDSEDDVTAKKGADVEALKKDKEHFDVKFAKIETSGAALTVTRSKSKKFTSIAQAKTKGVIGDEGDEEKDSNEDKIRKNKARLALSVGDIEEVSKLNNYLQSPKPKDDDENLCQLCCINVPDAILMGCGHGGICYDCAVTLVKKKDECLECRRKVDAIYRIDPNPKLENIIKAVEINKLVKTTSVA